jgi:hypothetical protein
MATPNDAARARHTITIDPEKVAVPLNAPIGMDRVAFTSHPSHRTDNKVAQLQRCVDKANRSMVLNNAVPAYLGDNPKRRQVVIDADWAAHNAYLRKEWALNQIAREAGLPVW